MEERTPLYTQAFNATVAEELNRTYGEIRNLQRIAKDAIDMLTAPYEPHGTKASERMPMNLKLLVERYEEALKTAL